MCLDASCRKRGKRMATCATTDWESTLETPSVEAVAAAGVAPVATTESLGGPRLLQPSLRCVPRRLAETPGLWVPAVIHGTALLPDDDGGRAGLLWILASGLPREAGRQPHVATLHPIPPRTHFWGMGECKAAEPVFRKGVLPRGHMSFLPVALLALAWPGLTWYPWCMCLNLHFSYAVCLCNRLATNKPPGGANYNPHIAP